MICIFCISDTEVINSRAKAKTPSVWRRRNCKNCARQFTTLELPDYEKALLVKDAKKIYFKRDKLFLSLLKSLGHRNDAINSATALTSTVIAKLLDKQRPEGELTKEEIAKQAHEVLKRYDPLAATTFKAYHQASLKRK